MKRPLIVAACLLVVLAGVGYASRGYIRDALGAYRAPKLPPATAFKPPIKDGAVIADVNSPFEAGYSTSQHYILEATPPAKPKDPLAFSGELPKEVNLDVPFTSQAPSGDWSYPYQEACEEASVLMVDAYFQGKTGRISPTVADTAIKQLVAYENKTLGFYQDTTAEQTAELIRRYFGYQQVIVKPFVRIEDVKQALALGYPVIIPASGKALHNPNFKNGGPPYHMLVVRGYTPTQFITNDPGTRNGMQYVYDFDVLLKAAHDWTGDPETITSGKPVMLIVIPNVK